MVLPTWIVKPRTTCLGLKCFVDVVGGNVTENDCVFDVVKATT
jgi:hypothetical protein